MLGARRRRSRGVPMSSAQPLTCPPSAGSPTHRLVPSPAGRVHLVEQGEGPLVLLVHGFPESWYSWRHQLPALAAAGYRAVAVDMRGYGRSSRPADAAAYRMLDLVEDGVAVVRALGEETAVVVGHDWGATVAAHSALVRPDVFRAVGLLGVPYTPPGGPRPSEVFAGMGGDEEFYVSYFQEPGRAEAEIEPDVRGWLAGFYAALSGDTMPGPDAPDPHFVSRGGRLRDRFPAVTGVPPVPGAPGASGARLPAWLDERDLDVYAEEFERTGLTGALNRYRAMDRDWEDLTPRFAGAPVRRPSLFVGGALDASTTWLADAIEAFPDTLPGLRSSHVLDGCGHWVQQERPDEVNGIVTDWLGTLDA
ncbi:alpha/beta fold hydrolase [Streptomyces sp. SID335]|nr:alpha/beta fold hydrolase [Streptomyces sp. SID335]MYZ19469.1 alpha/beta fold hydrolase [Streptomyces sp. SID337]NDZ86128.1 alpha/beta hydrolase [Streptomyces sp. SID10115]NEA03843.1 alpha/beta hydrolase [Streptomyces sp. SID10116]NEB44277.1 alpha/beta hydrolase [Streptomyces sp. SID339]